MSTMTSHAHLVLYPTEIIECISTHLSAGDYRREINIKLCGSLVLVEFFEQRVNVRLDHVAAGRIPSSSKAEAMPSGRRSRGAELGGGGAHALSRRGAHVSIHGVMAAAVSMSLAPRLGIRVTRLGKASRGDS